MMILLLYSFIRELQLTINDELTGVLWPFPIFFTSGVFRGLGFIRSAEGRDRPISFSTSFSLLVESSFYMSK